MTTRPKSQDNDVYLIIPTIHTVFPTGTTTAMRTTRMIDTPLRMKATNRRYYIGVALNIALVVVQALVGFWIGSMALLGDAGHNAGDVLGLILALWAMRLAKRKPDARHTYGYARSTIFAANINAALLLIASGALAVESIRRFGEPVAVPGFWVMIAAGRRPARERRFRRSLLGRQPARQQPARGLPASGRRRRAGGRFDRCSSTGLIVAGLVSDVRDWLVARTLVWTR